MATELDLGMGGSDDIPSVPTDPVDMPILNRLDASRYEYRGQQITRQGRGYAIEGEAGIHRTIFHATSRLDEMRKAAFSSKAESVGPGIYQVGGTEIHRRSPRSWEVSSTGETFKTLKAATANISDRMQSIFTNPQYQATIIGRNTGVSFSAHSTGANVPRHDPINLHAYTHTSGQVRSPVSLTGDMLSSKSADASSFLDPSSLVPKLSPPLPGALPSVLQDLTPGQQRRQFFHAQRDKVESMLQQAREYSAQYSMQMAQITTGYRAQTDIVRGRIRDIKQQGNDSGFVARIASKYFGIDRRDIPGNLFDSGTASQLEAHRAELTAITDKKFADKQALRDQKLDYVKDLRPRLHAVRGSNFDDQAGFLNTAMPQMPGMLQNSFGGGAPPAGGGPYLMPGGAPGGGSGRVAGLISRIPGGLAGLAVGLGVATLALRRMADIAGKVNHAMQFRISGLIKGEDDPLAYEIQARRNSLDILYSTNPGVGMLAKPATDVGFNILDVANAHASRLSSKMKGFAPETLSGSIEDKIRMFQQDAAHAQQLDPTIRAIDAAKTESVLAMREFKTTLLETFGPLMVAMLTQLTLMLKVINTFAQPLAWIVQSFVESSSYLKVLMGIGKWMQRNSTAQGTANAVQAQIGRFFGTRSSSGKFPGQP